MQLDARPTEWLQPFGQAERRESEYCDEMYYQYIEKQAELSTKLCAKCVSPKLNFISDVERAKWKIPIFHFRAEELI